MPSVGVSTASYACRTPHLKAEPISFIFAISRSLKPLAIPSNSCDSITPELPLALSSMPFATLRETPPSESNELPSRAFMPPSKVICMLLPVSPSGIGNTLRSLILAAFCFKFSYPPLSMFANCAESSSVTGMFISSHFYRSDRICHFGTEGKKTYCVGTYRRSDYRSYIKRQNVLAFDFGESLVFERFYLCRIAVGMNKVYRLVL